jgi:hypothetical protein
MSRPRRLGATLTVFLLAAAGAFFSALQAGVVAASCARNLSEFGSEGTDLTRETGGAVVRCHYHGADGRDVDYVISTLPAVIAMVLTATIALIALVQTVRIVRSAPGA